MDRRKFVTLVAGACLFQATRGSRAANGQGIQDRVANPGELNTTSKGFRIELEALRIGLRDLGWVEGKNLIIETRWAGGNPQHQRELAAQL